MSPQPAKIPRVEKSPSPAALIVAEKPTQLVNDIEENEQPLDLTKKSKSSNE